MASVSTRDHQEIQRWAEEHGACPAVVSRTGGMLRFEFNAPESLADVDWDDFFHVFDERGLELIYDDKPGSRFHKLVYPETVAARERGQRKARPSRPRPRLQIAPSRRKEAADRAEPGQVPAAGATRRATAAKGRAAGTSSKTGARRGAAVKTNTKRSRAAANKSRPRKKAA